MSISQKNKMDLLSRICCEDCYEKLKEETGQLYNMNINSSYELKLREWLNDFLDSFKPNDLIKWVDDYGNNSVDITFRMGEFLLHLHVHYPTDNHHGSLDCMVYRYQDYIYERCIYRGDFSEPTWNGILRSILRCLVVPLEPEL